MKASAEDKIRALKAARVLIVCRAKNYICLALNSVSIVDQTLRKACKEMQRYISRELSGSRMTLMGWLQTNRPLLDRSPEGMRAYRLQWIDWMIASLEGNKP
jgi:hypothetical protein